MKIIGFVASSRKEGNTAWIVNRILEGAKERGAETQSFYFNDLVIQPCQSCYGCTQGDRGCVIEDDMQQLYDAIEDANALVLGSPVYMGQMSAQAKIFTDRLFALLSARFSPCFKENIAKKKLVLLFDQGNPDPDMFRTYFEYTKDMFRFLNFDVKGVPVVAGMRNGPAREREELPTALRDIGASLVLE